jgi:hypothetical protein
MTDLFGFRACHLGGLVVIYWFSLLLKYAVGGIPAGWERRFLAETVKAQSEENAYRSLRVPASQLHSVLGGIY